MRPLGDLIDRPRVSLGIELVRPQRDDSIVDGVQECRGCQQRADVVSEWSIAIVCARDVGRRARVYC